MSGILMASVGNSYGAAPVNTVAPVVTGTATVGSTLTTTDGTWTGAPAPTFTYQWFRSPSTSIGGATSSTYVLVAGDFGFGIFCRVKATNTIAPSGVTADSNTTAAVGGTAPVNTVAPVVSGTATVGQTLSTTDGTWTGVPTPTFTYQWQRVTTNISGATSSTYVLVAADVGNTIRCVVTATNAAGSASANSNSTASVSAAVPGAPTIGTATQTSPTTATVDFTAPASNGGSTITSYTATSSPSGITGTLSQAGSGTITITGLTTGTSYTFTVTATNAIGTSAASAASNSVTPALPAIGAAFGGGFYAGQISTAGNGIADYNLVVGPVASAESSSKQYKNANTATSGADSVIDGLQNTVDMVAAGNSTVYPAAHFCNDLVIGGFSDWYMPAKNELEVCYYNLKPGTASNSTSSGTNTNAVPSRGSNYTAGTPAQTSAATFQTGNAEAFALANYWTSTDFGTPQTLAFDQNFFNGGQGGNFKDYPNRVRAIRKIAV